MFVSLVNFLSLMRLKKRSYASDLRSRGQRVTLNLFDFIATIRRANSSSAFSCRQLLDVEVSNLKNWNRDEVNFPTHCRQMSVIKNSINKQT